MTREERKNKLLAYIKCLKCKVSGKPCDDNCSIQYEAGTMGEIIENLEIISEWLVQEPIDKSAMMHEIYMEGVNMSGEYQGCWVRFKNIEKIVDKYKAESEETE